MSQYLLYSVSAYATHIELQVQVQGVKLDILYICKLLYIENLFINPSVSCKLYLFVIFFNLLLKIFVNLYGSLFGFELLYKNKVYF